MGDLLGKGALGWRRTLELRVLRFWHGNDGQFHGKSGIDGGEKNSRGKGKGAQAWAVLGWVTS